jgi:mannitol/fructose-specific phosphotransferase system IIA component (Ntr-type)
LGPNQIDPLTIAAIMQITTPSHGTAAKSNIAIPHTTTSAELYEEVAFSSTFH